MTRTQPEEDAELTDAVRRSQLSIALMVFLGAGAFASIPLIVITLKRRDSLYGDILFPVVLIAGLVSLLAAIALLVFVLRSLGLEDRRFALGMPDGSIRAIIAVMLILLFAMMAIFLYIDTANGTSARLDSISKKALDEIPATRLVDVRTAADDAGRYAVVLRNDRPAASTDLAKQLVTTISTLVVAISAFYFGAQSVESSRRTRPASTSSTPPAPAPPAVPPVAT